jgi:glutaredoxin
MMTQRYILYSTEGCHLCEQAYELCQQAGIGAALRIIDIAEDEQLAQQYGVLIPVLAKSAQEQLFWPFDLTQLKEFIG